MRLWAGSLAVKACEQLTRGQPRYRVAPAGCDLDQRREDEAARAEGRVRNCQRGRSVCASRPGDDVEVERSASPAASGAATMGAFDGLEAGEQCGWGEVAFDQRNGVGVAAACGAKGGRSVDRGRCQKYESRLSWPRKNRSPAKAGAQCPARNWAPAFARERIGREKSLQQAPRLSPRPEHIPPQRDEIG